MKVVRKPISDAELDRQIREAEKRGVSEPEAMSARYSNGKVEVELASGWSFTFDPRLFSEFATATEKELEDIGLWGRYTLTCPPLDVDLGIGSVIFYLIGDRFINAEASRRRGEMTSEMKKSSSRENGKLGGRPKKS